MKECLSHTRPFSGTFAGRQQAASFPTMLLGAVSAPIRLPDIRPELCTQLSGSPPDTAGNHRNYVQYIVKRITINTDVL